MSYICGIDEAGRGPIAGPIVIAGVVLDNDISNLNDSKKLSPKKREILFNEIIKNSKYSIEIFSSKDIDRFGLSQIYKKALNNILSKIEAKKYILDGNTNYKVLGVEAVIKADNKFKEVMAASILAKVTRDKIMIDLSTRYPNYQFDKHKGYCTKKHLELIEKFGICEIHRKSFNF